GSLEQSGRVVELGAAVEADVDRLRVDGDVDEAVAQPFARREADGQRVVSVVDELDRPGRELSHALQAGAGERRGRGIELREKGSELCGGSRHRPSRANGPDSRSESRENR